MILPSGFCWYRGGTCLYRRTRLPSSCIARKHPFQVPNAPEENATNQTRKQRGTRSGTTIGRNSPSHEELFLPRQRPPPPFLTPVFQQGPHYLLSFKSLQAPAPSTPPHQPKERERKRTNTSTSLISHYKEMKRSSHRIFFKELRFTSLRINTFYYI